MTVERFPVEAGHVMMFARAIGDHRLAEQASSGEGEVLAPPTFSAASAHFDPEYPLRPQPGQPWMGSGATASGAPLPGADGDGAGSGGTTLHAEQHFTYHRPLRAGDVLTAHARPGQEWDKTSRSGGTLRFNELLVDYRDADGELVLSSRAVAVTTGAAPSGEGA